MNHAQSSLPLSPLPSQSRASQPLLFHSLLLSPGALALAALPLLPSQLHLNELAKPSPLHLGNKLRLFLVPSLTQFPSLSPRNASKMEWFKLHSPPWVHVSPLFKRSALLLQLQQLNRVWRVKKCPPLDSSLWPNTLLPYGYWSGT